MVDGLADVLHPQPASDEQQTGEEDCASYFALLAVHVDLGVVGHCGLDFPYGLYEFVEGDIVVILKIQMLELPILIPLGYCLIEAVLVFVFADVPHYV